MNIEACYYLGYTSKVHGKQGEIIIKLDVDDPEEYNNLESVLIQLNKKDNSLIPFFLSNTQVQNNGTLRIKIEDVDSVDEADSFRLGTTTSMRDSGLLDVLIEDFERLHDIDVEYVAVGTGAALELGRNGDVDALIVHAPDQEAKFI